MLARALVLHNTNLKKRCQLQIQASLSVMLCFLTVMHCVEMLQSGLHLVLEFRTCFKDQCCWNSPITPPLPLPALSLPCLFLSQGSIQEDTKWASLGSNHCRVGVITLEVSNMAHCVVTPVLVLTQKSTQGKMSIPAALLGWNLKVNSKSLVLTLKLVHIVLLIIWAVISSEKYIYLRTEMKISPWRDAYLSPRPSESLHDQLRLRAQFLDAMSRMIWIPSTCPI